MGYINSATTITLNAKLTPIGKKKLVSNNGLTITEFSLGDSDANYYTNLSLTTGQVPNNSGNDGLFSTSSNSIAGNVKIKSYLKYNATGSLKKPVEAQSNTIASEIIQNQRTSVTGGTITQKVINRNNTTTDSLTNLFYTFGLPLNTTEDYTYTAITQSNGGYSDTTMSGIAATSIAIIAIPSTMYGELIDGKSLKVVIRTTAPQTYTLYSTFQNTGQPLNIQDAKYSDDAPQTSFLGNNIALLFSDEIQKPNNDSSLSWSNGFEKNKPFSVNGKQLYNLSTNTNLNKVADKMAGIAYLDKGFIVITNQQIVNEFDTSNSGTSVTLNSVSTSVFKNVTCFANRGEFGYSTNKTFSVSDTPRISEIGLYDADGDLVVMAKTDRQIVRNVNEFLALGIKFNV